MQQLPLDETVDTVGDTLHAYDPTFKEQDEADEENLQDAKISCLGPSLNLTTKLCYKIATACSPVIKSRFLPIIS